ncbi:MAG: universal stress protein UspA [Alphaproteobacteria bacterium]|nr:universal stress protein UspA [Alphaproteobacteria bacterium]
MAYRSILVPLEESEILSYVLATALVFAKRYDSYIEGLCIRPTLAGAVAVGFEGGAAALSGTEEQFEQEQRARADRLREQFEAFIAQNDIPTPQSGQNKLCADWVEDEASGIGIFGQRARVFDLTVVGRPMPGAMTPAMNTLETVLFESGRPVLIAPPSVPQDIGQHIVVAWNGGTETARAIAFAKPLMREAGKITVLAVEGGMVPGPTAEEVRMNLARDDVQVDVCELSGRRSAAEAGRLILSEARALEGDLLIKGGYTQSRLRQMIFGGATSEILAHAEIPVLMAH